MRHQPGRRRATRPETHTISIDGMRFQPDVLTVASRDTIVWVNKDLGAHIATSESGGFESKIIQRERRGSSPSRKERILPTSAFFIRLLHGDPHGRSVHEQMVHQCVTEDAWFRSMLDIDVCSPPLPRPGLGS